MLDLFYPPAPSAPANARRVLLLDAAGEVTPDAGQLQPRRPSKFDGMTADEYRAYRREQQQRRKAQVKAAGDRYRAKRRTAAQEAFAQRKAFLSLQEQTAVDAALKNHARRCIEDLREARELEMEDA